MTGNVRSLASRYMHIWVSEVIFILLHLIEYRLLKVKEWVDKTDPGATILPFSGALETKLLEMETDEERDAWCKEHGAQRWFHACGKFFYIFSSFACWLLWKVFRKTLWRFFLTQINAQHTDLICLRILSSCCWQQHHVFCTSSQPFTQCIYIICDWVHIKLPSKVLH